MLSRPPRVLALFTIILFVLLVAVGWYLKQTGDLFFVLSKILAFILMPLTWVFILFICSRLVASERKRKRLFWISLASLYIFTNSFIADEFMRMWEVKYDKENYAPEMDGSYDYAVVLGGMTWYNPKLKKPQFMRGADRLFQALWLVKQKKVTKIIFTGGSGSLEHPEEKEGAIIATWLRQMGFPDSCFIVESESKNTRENALFTKKILDSLNYKKSKVLLITSAFHMRRSLACFKKAGVEGMIPYITDGYSGPRKFVFDHCFIPQADALNVYNILIHEIVGYLTYKAIGYC
jgi:uncharacterized SAM-binding protein YcdF (DUF218 family)